MDKTDVVHIQWNITQPSKIEILPFAMTWMELEGVMLSEISQSDKNRYHDFTHMWNLRNKQMNIGEGKEKENKRKTEREANHKRLLTIGNKLRVAEAEWTEGWGNWVMGIKKGT